MQLDLHLLLVRLTDYWCNVSISFSISTYILDRVHVYYQLYHSCMSSLSSNIVQKSNLRSENASTERHGQLAR
ncbi:hypothetical protein BKA82DRAFT_997046 [Pisolithus tinctorius]|uniref:Uncharacterized protein n=1 Tax=Pisolithus tinctorius Marx 270 TaxID=870435 RepID=A0A0C3P6E3_PISTI|nr:hypothetical protein BKA82DRAFT_997046 [Pisolithus tinctorius]KIO08850.1 hypothetical protein M404DRAFT_997046 [Pisolithus tinctorius Marx 270]